MHTSKQQWTPNFPIRGYSVVLSLGKKQSTKSLIYPLRRFCKTRLQIDRSLDEFQNALRTERSNHSIKLVYIIELRFSKTWKLKPEYWSAPGTGFDEPLRDKLFNTFLTQYTNRQSGWLMLVTPESRTSKAEYFSIPMPLKLVTRDQDTEAFLKYSNWPLSENATDVAMYTVENIFEYELVHKSSQRRAE